MTRTLVSTILLLLLPVSSALAQETKPAYLKAYERGGLPTITDPVEFADAHSFPPRLKGLTVDRDVELDVRDTETVASKQRLAAARPIALRDARVKSAAGTRHVALGGGVVEADKDAADSQKASMAVDFYNYDTNRAYRAILVDDQVVRVQERPKGFQPKETRAEIQSAAGIVAKDPKHARAIAGLDARGLRAPPAANGDRLLYLLFYRGKERPARYEATVNMSKGQVVQAKAISQ